MSEKIRPQQLNRTLAFVRKEREKTKVYEKKTFLYEVESSGEKNSYVQHSDTKRLYYG